MLNLFQILFLILAGYKYAGKNYVHNFRATLPRQSAFERTSEQFLRSSEKRDIFTEFFLILAQGIKQRYS